VLGIVQGLTEFAPVSSSGHLILVPWLFHWSILNNEVLNKTFDVALHMGTLLGALIYFWSDVVRYVKAWFASIRRRSIGSVDEKLAWALVIGTIPGALAGALFESTIEEKLGQPWLIAVMLAVFGVVLYVVDRICRADRSFETIGPRTGWWAGGWGTCASDFLAMASQSQIAGQYFFLLIGASAVGTNASNHDRTPAARR